MKHVSLLALSEEGRKRHAEAAQLFAETVAITEGLGGKIVDVYALNSQWDFVAIIEYPNTEAAFEARLKALELGIFSTIDTYEAFNMDLYLSKV
jgi:uncharacterized protein with GYD domain